MKFRISSILDQTFSDWECIVIDGYSSNGSWEFLNQTCGSDARFKLYQCPKKGIYNAWNEGIKRTLGEYVYIATSDDTCYPDFLKTMVAGLDKHASCDLAHCCLHIIDEQGTIASGNKWDSYLQVQYFGGLIRQKHIRHAPHDGILHAFIKTIYQSITQLLIRRRVFDDVGFFLEDEGSIADFEWGMRVSSVKNTLHIPEYLATWRVHEAQATTSGIQSDPATYAKLCEWVASNVKALKRSSPGNPSTLDDHELIAVYKQNQRHFALLQLRKKSKFISRIYQRLFPESLRYTDGLKEARRYFQRYHLDSLIEVI